MDALSNLVKVTEPNPAGGNWETTYTYNARGQLLGVAMGVQTRAFNYDANGVMTSAVNPENGTVTYVYDSTGLLTETRDAKGQKVTYEYDSNRRLWKVHRHSTQFGPEDANQYVEYYYDNSSPLGGYAVNGWGRLTGVAYKAYSGSRVFAEGYTYTAGGLVAAKKMRPLPTRLRSAGRGRWRRSNRSTTRRS